MFTLTTHEYIILCGCVQTRGTSWQKAVSMLAQELNTNDLSLAWIHKTPAVIIPEKPFGVVALSL